MKHIQTLAILHLVGIFCGVSFGGIVFPLVYYLIKKDEFHKKDTQVFYDIMNFQISFFLYFTISAILVIVLVGLLGLLLFGVLFLINFILGFIDHLHNKRFKYYFVIPFLK